MSAFINKISTVTTLATTKACDEIKRLEKKKKSSIFSMKSKQEQDLINYCFIQKLQYYLP